MEFIRSLSESKLFPSIEVLDRYSKREVAELLYLYIIAMRVLLSEESTRFWATVYLKKTIQGGNFSSWRSNGNDFYVLIHAMQTKSDDKHTYPIRISELTQWIKHGAMHGEFPEHLTRRLFVRLDFDLRVKHESMKAIRRLVGNWSTLDTEYRRLAMTRLLQFIRSRSPKSDIFLMLYRLAEVRDYELKNVFNMETGEFENEAASHPKKTSFLQKLTGTKR